MKPITIITCAVLLGSGAARAADRLEDFRIVDGQLYNVQKSVQWERLGHYNNVVVAVLTNGLIVQERWTRRIYAPAVPRISAGGGGPGRLISEEEKFGAVRFLKNFPAPVVTGQEIGQPAAMRIGTFAWRGDVLAAYDCGLPNTPENRLTLRK